MGAASSCSKPSQAVHTTSRFGAHSCSSRGSYGRHSGRLNHADAPLASRQLLAAERHHAGCAKSESACVALASSLARSALTPWSTLTPHAQAMGAPSFEHAVAKATGNAV